MSLVDSNTGWFELSPGVSSTNEPMKHYLSLIRYRLGQGITHLRPANPNDVDLSIAETYLSQGTMAAFRSMPVRDQIHHCCVARTLLDGGWLDAELLQATLLHDVGKFHNGRGPNVAVRSSVVLLGRIWPGLLTTATRSQTWWNGPLYRAVHHSEIGARIAGSLGCSERTVWLIAHHADNSSVGNVELHALQRADGAC